ncbi:unnamed protein product [Durusdinium trenchii]|uniref:DUF7869 domain-containing protein n=1 Tax=Durusdinium trenchii TaxID=1381693 RepID=A0ABP0NXY0_9DINO
MLIDGMDQAKFRCPRNLRASATFANLSRPPLHMTGCVLIGVVETFYLLEADTKKDSNMVATCLAHCLDKGRRALELKGAGYGLPRHLIIAADNCSRENKNMHLATFGAYLISKGHFDSVEFQFMLTGHTKNELDQRFSSVATTLRQASTLESPSQFSNWLSSHLEPVLGSQLCVEVLSATWDFQSWFASFQLSMKGLTATHLEPDTNHCWRMMLRKNLEPHATVVCHNSAWSDLPEDPNDVVLLMLPAHLHKKLKQDDLQVSERRKWSEEVLIDYRKAAKAVAADPWRLFEAQKWLEDLCDENQAMTEKQPPLLAMVHEDGQFQDHCLLPDFEDLFIEDPKPREIKVGKGKAKAAPKKRPAAAVERAAEDPTPYKRPAAAAGVLRRPAAGEAMSEGEAGVEGPAAREADHPPADDQARAFDMPKPAAAVMKRPARHVKQHVAKRPASLADSELDGSEKNQEGQTYQDFVADCALEYREYKDDTTSYKTFNPETGKHESVKPDSWDVFLASALAEGGWKKTCGVWWAAKQTLYIVDKLEKERKRAKTVKLESSGTEPTDDDGGEDVEMLAHAPLEPNQKWVDMMKEALDGQPGGPAVYLTKLFPSDVEKTSFSKWLFPERSDICYHHKSEIPHVQEQQMAQTPPLALHIAAFGWEDGCGVKPPPGRDLALQLMDWFCKDGFVTSGEPILIAQPLGLQTSVLEAPWQGSDDTSADQCLKPFTVGYIKGRARMTSILALLGLIYSHEESFDFRSQWPQLYDSLSVIWVHHLRQSTKEDEVLCNMKLSMRGSLRKACNVVQMASMIKRLMAEGGTDYPSFVRRFNSQTVQSHQIRGRKAAALKLLFESDVLDAILTHVNNLGWPDSAWTEENLSSKRLFTGHQFPAKTKKWMCRVRVTDDSLRLMTSRVHFTKEHPVPNMPSKKDDSGAMEAVAEKAAALTSLAAEFCSEHPVSIEVVREKVLEEWARGCERIDCELTAALLEKNEGFQVGQSMPCFKALLEDNIFKAPVSSTQEVALRSALKKDEYEMVIKKMDYDRKVYEIWQQKCTSVSVARQHARQEHFVAEHAKVVESVEGFVDGCVRLPCWENMKGADSLIPQILAFRQDMLKKLRTQSTAAVDVPTVVLMNWTAPCLLAASRQKDHSNVLAWALHDNTNSCGVIFSPTFSWNKGKTFLEEHAAMQVLLSGGHNLDFQFSLLFSERCDQRDTRPLLYPARFAFPGYVVDLQKSNLFFQSELRKAGRTEPCKQLPAKDLKEMEDLAADSLPTSTSSNFISGAAKHCQLGLPAAEEVIRKIFAGPDLEQVPAVIVLDLFPRVGDFTHAFCKVRSSIPGTSIFYVGVVEKAKDLEWLRVSLVDDLVEKAKGGQFQFPGQRAYQKDIPSDLLEALPQFPILNLLVTSGEGEFRKLQIPKPLVQKWRTDSDFGDEFGTWLDNFCEKYSVAENEQTSQTSPNKNKRDGEEPENPTPVKKNKVEEVGPEFILANDKVQETLLFEAKLQGKDSLSFQIRTGHQLFVVNSTPSELSVKPGTALVGFGRGSFKLVKDNEVLSEKAMVFEMSSESLVSLNGVVSTVSEVLAKQRETKPSAEVCYHKATLVPDKLGVYDFRVTHKVAFVPAAAGKNDADQGSGTGKDDPVSASNIAAREPSSTFQGMHSMSLVWHVKWTVKGLQPVKVMLHCMKQLVLPAGQCCKVRT